jgi:hypothetical protein
MYSPPRRYLSLQDRGDILAIRSFAQMTLSEDSALRIAMGQCIEDERCFREPRSDPAALFLEWEDDGFTRTGTSTIIVRARRASKALGVGLKRKGSLLVIKSNRSKKTDAVMGIRRYLTQKVARPQKFQKFKKLMSKIKHGAIFAILENNLVSNKMLTDAKTMRSDAFFRFTVAARADVLPTSANVQQWYRQPRTVCQRCNKHTERTLAHILNGCQANCTGMTRRHNEVVDMVRRAIEKHMVDRPHSGIGENTTMGGEGLSEEMRRLRPDLNFVLASMCGTRFTVMIDISCPYGHILDSKNTLQKVYVDKLEKYK